VTPAGHAIVSQKKAKKYEREARRKAKKLVVDEDAEVAMNALTEDAEAALNATAEDDGAIVESDHHPELDTGLRLGELPNTKEVLEVPAGDATIVCTDEPEPEPRVASLVATPPTVHNSKHSHWTRFARQFNVDQLAEPSRSVYSGCAHLTTCVYEINGEVDCPYHKPRK
jgi:hypothetical protein